ncbi:DUF397 domain-containing protein [Streptomyces sp. NPDC056165]|uniref:DUF397 domain-containing protein n=1 Tax=Streptomyces sp. NPDC056165 TaxID=3345733 RepID=UPI0035DD0D5A
MWRRSSRCGNENECVEVAVSQDCVLARDSKVPARSALCFTTAVWTDFLQAVRVGELEGS